MTEHIANLAGANADIACGNVGIGAEILLKLGHKCLTETHNFVIGFALGVEICAALTAAHRKTGKRVLKGLLEAKELDYRGAYAGVEAATALVGTDCAVELNAEAAVNLNLAAVVNPSNAELNKAFGFYDSVHNCFVIGALVDNGGKRFEYFANCLQKFLFACVALFYLSVKLLKIFVADHNIASK